MRRILATGAALAAVAATCLAVAGGAQASDGDRRNSGPGASAADRQSVDVDGGFRRFLFGDRGSARTFSLRSRTGVWLRVTDTFCKGDRFRVLLDGKDLGQTSEPTKTTCRNGTRVPRQAEPSLAWSSGGWLLPRGEHVVTVVVTRSPFETGAASLRADSSKFAGATLTGEAEVPGPGDNNGKGRLGVVLHPASDTICYGVRTRLIDDVVAGHIHAGRKPIAGPVVVDLQLPPGSPSNAACVAADPTVIDDIAYAPWNFYANVHTEAYPAGAVRGQLVPLY